MKNQERKYFAPGTLTAPLPPALVTVGEFEHANVLTIGWTGILSSTPPRTYISVRPSRHSHKILVEGGEFVINLPSVDMAREVDYAGIYSGKKVDKFEKCSFTKIASEKVAPPTIAECPFALECRVSEVVNMGSHDVFFADIVSVSCRSELVDGGGKMRFDLANLLAYAHGEYYALGERVGRFGFSTDKPESTRRVNKNTKTEKEKENKKRENKPRHAENKEGTESKKPFYQGLPKGKSKKRAADKDKGRPHGKGGRTKK